eukprot:Selendium_serpulae@DN4322_c0_g1_i3.p1
MAFHLLASQKWAITLPFLVMCTAFGVLIYSHIAAVNSGHTAVEVADAHGEMEFYEVWCPSIGLGSNHYNERAVYTLGMYCVVILMLGTFPFLHSVMQTTWEYTCTTGVVHRVDQVASSDNAYVRQAPVFALERSNSMPQHTRTTCQAVLICSEVCLILSLVALVVAASWPMQEDLIQKMVKHATTGCHLTLTWSTIINIRANVCFFCFAIAHMVLVACASACCTKAPCFTNGSITIKLLLVSCLILPHLLLPIGLIKSNAPNIVIRLNMDGIIQRWIFYSFFIFVGSYGLDFHSSYRYQKTLRHRVSFQPIMEDDGF